MAKGNYLGEFEYIVMLSLLRLGDDAYGMTIRQDIEENTQRPIAVGAVYAALERLEEKGYIKSKEGEATRGRGGRSKTYYKVNGAGLEAVRQTRSVFRRRESSGKRGGDFRVAIGRDVPPNLATCPLPGPERDAFLESRAAILQASGDLWKPVCRIAPVPSHRIIIVAKSRPELNACSAGSVWRPSNVICVLEERLGFLVDPKARRTWARREYGESIWVTSQAVAWEDHLVSEHRQWMVLALLLCATAWLLAFSAQHARYAFACRAECHRSGGPEVPRKAELMLHWVLGRECRSLPGDLSEEFTWKIENGCCRKEADLWYRWQVFNSIAPVLARRAEAMLTGGFWRGLFLRR